MLHIEEKTIACVGCSKQAPEATGNYTLISNQFGWRLQAIERVGGQGRVLQWRCPDCWAAHKRRSVSRD
jgi:hypothetical protein